MLEHQEVAYIWQVGRLSGHPEKEVEERHHRNNPHNRKIVPRSRWRRGLIGGLSVNLRRKLD